MPSTFSHCSAHLTNNQCLVSCFAFLLLFLLISLFFLFVVWHAYLEDIDFGVFRGKGDYHGLRIADHK